MLTYFWLPLKIFRFYANSVYNLIDFKNTSLLISSLFFVLVALSICNLKKKKKDLLQKTEPVVTE